MIFFCIFSLSGGRGPGRSGGWEEEEGGGGGGGRANHRHVHRSGGGRILLHLEVVPFFVLSITADGIYNRRCGYDRWSRLALIQRRAGGRAGAAAAVDGGHRPATHACGSIGMHARRHARIEWPRCGHPFACTEIAGGWAGNRASVTQHANGRTRRASSLTYDYDAHMHLQARRSRVRIWLCIHLVVYLHAWASNLWKLRPSTRCPRASGSKDVSDWSHSCSYVT